MGKAARRKQQAQSVDDKAIVGATSTGRKRESTEAAAGFPPHQASAIAIWLGPAIAGLEILFFLILKCYSLPPHRVDEGIYFYDGARLAEGARLYRDIFFAHPPLHLVLPTLLYRIVGYSYLGLKSMSQLFGAAQGLLAFVIARKVFKSDLAGVVATGTLLFSRDFLLSSAFFTGISQADALLWAALWMTLNRRFIVGGVLASAATMTLLQTAPMALIMAIAVVLHDRKQGQRFILGAAVFSGLIHLYFTWSAGTAFFDQVYLYHLKKTVTEAAGERQLGFLIADNPLLFVGGALAAALSLTGLEPAAHKRRFILALGVGVLLQLVAMGAQPRVFPFYFQPTFLPLALAVGGAVALGVERARRSVSTGGKVGGAALAAAVLAGPILFAGPITDLVSSRRASQRRTYSMTYTWQDAPLLGGLNAAVRALLWDNGVRVAGSSHLTITEFLWNQSRHFDSYQAIVDEVRLVCERGTTLFGDSGSVPLVALGAGLRITADFADTNAQRFASGTTTVEEAISQLEARGGPRAVLAAGNSGLFGLPGFQAYLRDHYQSDREFSDGDGTRYTLYRRLGN